MSHTEKEQAPAKAVRKNNLKLDKTEESKSPTPSRDVSPTTSIPKKPSRKNTMKSDGGSQFSEKQP